MLKKISAALLAVSVLAAPALAASSDKTTSAPASKTTQVPAAKAAQVPADKATQVKPKAAQVKPSALNANAKMGHHRHYRHHRSHKHMSALKSHQVSKASIKHIGATTKRG